MSIRTQPVRRQRAFTLIELLVVIAIIAILAAILFPVFAQAREKARAISCISNLKQLGTAMIMYTQDYDETLPYWNFSVNADGFGGNGQFGNFWFNAVYPYVKNAQVYQCPDDNTKLTPAQWFPAAGWTKEAPAAWGLNPAVMNAVISYGMTETMMCGEINGNWGSSNPANNKSMAITLAYLQKPAQTMALADTMDMTGGTIYGNGEWGMLPDPNNPNDILHQCLIYKVAYANAAATPPTGGFPYGQVDPPGYAPAAWDIYARHTAGTNMAFCDGHAKWLRDSTVSDDYVMGTQAN